MPEARSPFLARMLDRLYASLLTGPSLNARPHHSRQRLDLAQLTRLSGTAPGALVTALLGEAGRSRLDAPARLPTTLVAEGDAEGAAQLRAYEEQHALLRKLGTIAEDARLYEQDTGGHALHVGFPLLHVPPQVAARAGSGSRRLLAPIAFVPVKLAVRQGRTPGVDVHAVGEGIERVMPNTALLVWLEQQTGQKLKELFADETGADPWREVKELTEAVCRALEIPAPALGPDAPLGPAPRPDEEDEKVPRVVPAAVLGLFPLSNQSLLQDLEALANGERHEGPVRAFLEAGVGLGASEAAPSGRRPIAEERLVTQADPCQAHAVRMARHARGLVIHGPPGTGKSQTITNVIGDHLARGERVLVVCDKRTALDVVKHRLDHLGLGELCAVVHDAQRDQRDLYLSIRDQLEALPDARSEDNAGLALSRLDDAIDQVHARLTDVETALSQPPAPGAPSFHALAGEWLELDADGGGALALDDVPPDVLAAHERPVREALERATREGLPGNPWREALGVDLAAFLARPVPELRVALARALDAARLADAALAGAPHPLPPDGDVVALGEARARLAERLDAALATGSGDELAHWAGRSREEVAEAHARLEALAPQLALLEGSAPDPELEALLAAQPEDVAGLTRWQAALDAYLAVARRWWAPFAWGQKKAAREVLARLGLALGPAEAERARAFVALARARLLVLDFHARAGVGPAPGTHAALVALTRRRREALGVVAALDVGLDVRSALSGPPEALRTLALSLRAALPRARALAALEPALEAVGLFSPAWLDARRRQTRAGAPVGDLVAALAERLPTVEGLLRLERLLAELPPPLARAVRALGEAGADVEAGWRALRRAALARELTERVKRSAVLQGVDVSALQALHERYQALSEQRRTAVRDALLQRWRARQRARLLASTGTRLNGAGAELKRRLMVRGERVLRVRQMVAAGAASEGGDPLFDLRPVWMASPETVAQIFPRAPLFDTVIFDESSQCRLEEALPVLTRARRVVIAGDPQQLPPTRFFESAVQQSAAEAPEPESDQALFEEQQAEVEDLLQAALNLEIEQSHLDVHYRSKSADLIAFSNAHFYGARLQALPGHPARRTRAVPVRLVHVGGTYEQRVNVKEAEAVVALVKELLARPQPPSVGVACFNLAQRDVILEALEDAAARDAAFAAKLEEARQRRGAGSFEGLFVKNLENVQGDERDHLILSTTYGPDPRGRFYRRFGPLGQAGGGRRLNVLVTRARTQVHVFTSIPREAYASLPPPTPGQVPNGAWLLLAYLQHAEALGARYAARWEATRAPTPDAPPAAPRVRTRETPQGSRFARALAERLLRAHGLPSDVNWGNDGFNVDVALAPPARPEEPLLGVLCDGSRYDKVDDRVEWDLFRAGVLAQGGWTLERVWTPAFLRDPDAALAALTRRLAAVSSGQRQ